jgi:uncharacterized protein YerC
MLAYPIPEAEDLLTSKLSTAKLSLENCEEDMDFLREQITVRTVRSLISKANTDCTIDVGGCDGEGIQLGRGAETQRTSRTRGINSGTKGRVA